MNFIKKQFLPPCFFCSWVILLAASIFVSRSAANNALLQQLPIAVWTSTQCLMTLYAMKDQSTGWPLKQRFDTKPTPPPGCFPSSSLEASFSVVSLVTKRPVTDNRNLSFKVSFLPNISEKRKKNLNELSVGDRKNRYMDYYLRFGSITTFSDLSRFLVWPKVAPARASGVDIRSWQLGQPCEQLCRPKLVKTTSFSMVLPVGQHYFPDKMAKINHKL